MKVWNGLESFLTKKYSVFITLLLLVVLIVFWIERSKHFQEKVNDLYVNGYKVVGYVTNVVAVNNNEGNIRSWDIHYYYRDKDSVMRTGVINEKAPISIGDSIFIQYAVNRTQYHTASIINKGHRPILLVSAMFSFHNMLLLTVMLLFALIILAQVLYWFRVKETVD